MSVRFYIKKIDIIMSKNRNLFKRNHSLNNKTKKQKLFNYLTT